MQSLSTRDPNVAEIIFMCVLRNRVPLKRFCLNGIRHKGREVVISRPVAIPPEKFFLSCCSSVRVGGEEVRRSLHRKSKTQFLPLNIHTKDKGHRYVATRGPIIEMFTPNLQDFECAL